MQEERAIRGRVMEKGEREREREREINSQLSRRPVQTPWGQWPCPGDSPAVVCEC